jgi:hypothetical protein
VAVDLDDFLNGRGLEEGACDTLFYAENDTLACSYTDGGTS